MAYRRPTEAAAMAGRWRQFTDRQHHLFENAGLPGSLIHDRGLFDYFLMHGDIEDGSGFDTSQLHPRQWKALDELVDEYVSQYYDPGVSLGPRPE